MKIAIMGGSFNPPHIGHYIVASQVLEFEDQDQIWLMPVFKHPFGKELVPADLRFQMLKLMEDSDVRISDFEIKEQKTNYTFETLTSLAKLYPQNQFSLIIGSDQIDSLGKWKEIGKLVENFEILVFPRHNDNDKSKKFYENKLISIFGKIHKNIRIIENKNLIQSNLSSSQIREKIKNNKSIKYMVAAKVEEFIKTNKLYEN